MAGSDPWDAISTPARGTAPAAAPVSGDSWDAVSAPAKQASTPAPAPATPTAGKPITLAPGVAPHDGDTFRLPNGQNARMFGVDAFELGQTGNMPSGPVDLGAMARGSLLEDLRGGGTVMPTGASTYGRPVVTVDANGDVGTSLVSDGVAVPTPNYLTADTERRDAYIAAQRDAIAAERGAYAGQYQIPADYRHQGASAPMHGKIPMTPEQATAYDRLVRDPKTTPADLEAWATSQGQAITNAGNILSFMRRNPTARLPGYFQQQDVTGTPVLPNGPDILTRTLGSLNEGIADTVGAPVDLVSAGMRAVGVPIGDNPFGGSASISSGLHALGVGQVDQGYAPRSDAERYAQSIARGFGQAAIPVGGTLSLGGRLALEGASALSNAGRAGVVRQALNTAAIEAARNPGLALAGEAGGAVGGGVGGQAARDAFPGNPWADMAGQIVGGGLGGFGAGFAARRPLPVGQRIVEAAENGTDAAGSQVEDQARGAAKASVAPATRTPDMLDLGGIRSPDVFPSRGQPSEYDAISRSADARPVDRLDVRQMPQADGPLLYSPNTMATGYRFRDRIDVSAPQPSAYDAFSRPADPIADPVGLGRTSRMDERLAPDQIAAMAQSVQPEDLLPRPSNEVGSIEEAANIGAGRYPELQAQNPRDQLSPFTLPGQSRPRRNPLDLNAWLRTQGGVQDQAGELSRMGVTNAPRNIPLAGDVGLPRLVNPQGMALDDAADAAWRAGYFPNHAERPTIGEFLDAVNETHRGGAGRVFLPDDYDAVSSYHGAVADRDKIEAAAARGEPIHLDQGQPVTLDDLNANSPPASAYEDLPKVWGRVGNIDVSKLNSAEDIGRAINGVQMKVGGFDAARRGQMAQEETRALAREMGMSADDLLRRRKGQALNAEQAVAARSILAKSSDELVRLARAASDPGVNSDSAVAAFRQAWVRHAAIQEQVSGATAEAGRALASFKMEASSRDVAGRIHRLMLEEGGGKKRLEDVAKAITDLAGETNDSTTVTKFANDALKPKWADKLSELYINSLLSGPQTHAANFLSNSLTAALQLPEHAAAAAFGMLRPGSADRVVPGELSARAFGMLQGVREGLAVAGRTMATGYVPDHVAKVEAAEQHAISGVKGSIIRTPTRALSAADELFKGIARRMELNGLALRQAQSEGVTGPDLHARVAELSSNPTDEMMEQAKDYARYVTFQRPLGEVGQAISRISQAKAGPVPVGKLIVPFVRTPANLMKFAVERSPAAPLLTEWRADFAAGGARRDLAIAKATLGSGLGMLIAHYAAEGKISGGGPADDGATAIMRADGWQPYSIKIGNQWVSYSRFDPVALTMGTAADLATKGDQMTEGQKEEAAGIITASIVKSLSDKTWLSGISDLMDLIKRPEQTGGSYLRNEAASLAVPALLAQIARASDPYQRETKTVMEAIRSRIPVLSQQVPARLDIWGEAVPRGNLPMGLSSVVPVNVSTIKHDPVAAALLDSGARVTRTPNKVGGQDLTREQARAYQIDAGRRTHSVIDALVRNSDWSGMTKEHRQDVVSALMRQSRKDAREELGFGGKKARSRSVEEALVGH